MIERISGQVCVAVGLSEQSISRINTCAWQTPRKHLIGQRLKGVLGARVTVRTWHGVCADAGSWWHASSIQTVRTWHRVGCSEPSMDTGPMALGKGSRCASGSTRRS